MNQTLRVLLVVSTVLLAGGMAAAARAQPVGEIARIAEQPRKPIAETTRAQLWRARGQPLHKNAVLIEDDRLELKGPVWIDLHVQRADVEARVVLAALEEPGVYRIEASSVTRLGGLRLAVERGSMLIELLHGELEALAADVSMIVHGTTVLLEADSTGAYCFLREGHVSFPTYDIVFTGENQLWRLESGQRPQIVSLDAGETDAWRARTRATEIAVRPLPIWRKPAFWLGAAAVAGAATYLLWPDGSGSVRGTVILPIPN